MQTIYDLTFDELAAFCAPGEEGVSRAKQAWAWLYERGVRDFSAMADLPAALRERLAASRDFHLPEPRDDAADLQTPTRKLLLRCRDGDFVESVAISSDRGYTFCLSTQVGCGAACTFCASGRMGLLRNLTPGEIVGQFLALVLKVGRPQNVVYMGMGEPFHNYDNVIRSLDILTHPEGIRFGQRRITVSTSGVVPEIYRFAREAGQVNLAVSLSGTTDSKRRRVMPIGGCYNLRQLLAAVDAYTSATHRRVTFEYVLLPGVNNSAHDALRLGDMCRNRLVSVNVIPFNSIKPSVFRAPSRMEVETFRRRLEEAGVNATVRWSAGSRINAACGQLAGRKAAGE